MAFQIKLVFLCPKGFLLAAYAARRNDRLAYDSQ